MMSQDEHFMNKEAIVGIYNLKHGALAFEGTPP
jgi:hypothetical protein